MLHKKTKSMFQVLAIAGGGALLIMAISILLYVATFGTAFSDSQEKWGQFGDYFGGLLNPIFGLAGFIALLYTIRLQRADLSDQRHSAYLAIFESRFFQMLARLNEIAGTVTAPTERKLGRSEFGKGPVFEPEGTVVGREAFARWVEIVNLASGANSWDVPRTYSELHVASREVLAHYFRMLCQIISYISNSELRDGEKNWYAAFLRDQLSDAETALLFYHGQSQMSTSGFKALIEQYGLLANLAQKDVRDIAWNERHRTYQDSAFIKRD